MSVIINFQDINGYQKAKLYIYRDYYVLILGKNERTFKLPKDENGNKVINLVANGIGVEL